MRTLTETWTWRTPHGPSRSPLRCNISLLSCTPYKLPWHPNASWEGCRGALGLGQSVMCLKTWQQLRAYPLRTTQLSVRTAPSFCRTTFFLPVLLPPEVRNRDEKEKKTEIVAASDKFVMSWRKQAIGAIYYEIYFLCVQFSYIWKKWLVGIGLVS